MKEKKDMREEKNRAMAVPETETEKDIRVCPVCGKEVERADMDFTTDCHGITFRLVCLNCWYRIMERGYDGVYYDESDEQIEPIW